MANKRARPEDISTKLRHVEVLIGSDMVVFFDPAVDCGLGLGLAGGLEAVGV